MEKEQIIKEINDKLDAFKGEMKQYVSKEDLNTQVEALKSEVAKLDNSDLVAKMKEVEDACFKQGDAIAKMKETTRVELTLKQQIEAKLPEIKRVLESETVEKAVFTPASITNNFNGAILTGIASLPQRKRVVQTAVTTLPIPANHQGFIRYMDETVATNGANTRAKGAAAGEGAVTLEGKFIKTQTISHIVPIELSMIEDADGLLNHIQQWVLTGLNLKVEQQIYAGDNTGVNLKGLKEYATEFVNSTNFTTKEASLVDLVKVVSTSISNNTEYMPNICLINPFDFLELETEKTDLGQLKYPMLFNVENPTLGSIKFIQTGLVASGELIIFDSDYVEFYTKGISLEAGWNLDDFSKRQRSILANQECALLIKDAKLGCIKKVSNITTAKQSITQGA